LKTSNASLRGSEEALRESQVELEAQNKALVDAREAAESANRSKSEFYSVSVLSGDHQLVTSSGWDVLKWAEDSIQLQGWRFARLYLIGIKPTPTRLKLPY